MNKNNQKGQALVLILLSLSVVLTLVLFILSRTVTDIATSSRDEESIRAFSAAEAGVEEALVVGSTVGSELSNASYNAQVSGIGEGTSQYNYPLSLAAGDTATVWFVAHDGDSNKVCSADKPCFTGDSIKVCWGKPGTAESTATSPAIEVSTFYTSSPNDYSTAKIARVALDPNVSRLGTNNFSASSTDGCAVGDQNYQFYANINFSDIGIADTSTQGVLQFARVRMVYNSDAKHGVGVVTANALPSQGLLVNSTGVSGESNRRLEVFQGWPEAPGIFDFAVFSPAGLTK